MPAVTRNTHGAGVGWYVSTRPDAAGLRAILDEVLADAGIELPGIPAGLEVVRRRGADADYVVAINHAASDLSLDLTGTDLISGSDAAGSLTVRAGDVAVVRTQRAASGGGR